MAEIASDISIKWYDGKMQRREGMRLSDCGKMVTDYIVKEVKEKRLILPTEVSLQLLERKLGCRAQSIGMAYEDGYIAKVLDANDILSRKCGRPVVLMLSKKEILGVETSSI